MSKVKDLLNSQFSPGSVNPSFSPESLIALNGNVNNPFKSTAIHSEPGVKSRRKKRKAQKLARRINRSR